jgi:hypothetical protein
MDGIFDIWKLFGKETTLGKEFPTTLLPSWIANQGYQITKARKADKDDGGKNMGFFFTGQEWNTIAKTMKNYTHYMEEIQESSRGMINNAFLKAAQAFPREHTVNYLAQVLFKEFTAGHLLKSVQLAAMGAESILASLEKELLPKIDPSKDWSGYFNGHPDVHAQWNFEYLTIPRPMFDYTRQYTGDEMEERVDLDVVKALAEKHDRKPAADYPNYKWIISKPAIDRYDELQRQDQKRDQFALGMYVSNDFYGYGQQEVIENALVQFADEFKKAPKDRSSAKLWMNIEGLAWHLCHGEFTAWYMIDDSQRVADTMHVIGYALLVALNHLERDGLLKPGSPVKNLPLVLSLFFHWAKYSPYFDYVENSSWDGAEVWLDMAALYARKHNIDIEGEGVYNIKEMTMKEPYNDPYMACTLNKDQEKWVLNEKYRPDKFRFKELVYLW